MTLRNVISSGIMNVYVQQINIEGNEICHYLKERTWKIYVGLLEIRFYYKCILHMSIIAGIRQVTDT